jgi:hypothetical protein
VGSNKVIKQKFPVEMTLNMCTMTSMTTLGDHVTIKEIFRDRDVITLVSTSYDCKYRVRACVYWLKLIEIKIWNLKFTLFQLYKWHTFIWQYSNIEIMSTAWLLFSYTDGTYRLHGRRGGFKSAMHWINRLTSHLSIFVYRSTSNHAHAAAMYLLLKPMVCIW